MSLREEQCKKVCRILDNVLANRPTERDSLIVAVRKAFKALAEPYEPQITSEAFDALQMAIEALKYSEVPNSSDTISRQAAIDALHMHLMYRMGTDSNKKRLDEWINNLPSAQPDIIRCRECKFASGDSRICMKFDHSPIGELDFCSFAERREVTT